MPHGTEYKESWQGADEANHRRTLNFSDSEPGRDSTKQATSSMPKIDPTRRASWSNSIFDFNSRVERDDGSDIPHVWVTVFRTLQDSDGLLPSTSIHSALQLIGHGSTDVKNVEIALKKAKSTSRSSNTLSLQEFSVFVDAYEELHEEEITRYFEKADINGDGTVTRRELGDLIREMDIKMLFPQVIDEVFKEVDVDRKGAIDVTEFREVMRILQQRQGFSKQEAMDVVEVFGRFDENQSGEVPISNLHHLLAWLGYHPEEHELADLATEIDQDKSGTISPLELPLFMRKYRELELEKVGHFFGIHDKDCSGSIELHEIEELLHNLGYPMKWSSLETFLHETSLFRSAKQGLVFEDFWRLLAYIRSKEGFVTAEVAEHYSAWARYAVVPEHAKDKYSKPHLVPVEDRRDWHLPTWEVSKALRWLGVKHVSPNQLKVLVDEVDVDQSQSLDFGEFSKIMRKLHENLANIIEQSFPPPDRDHAIAPKILLNSHDFSDILRELGINIDKAEKEAVFAEMELSSTDEANFYQCLAVVQQIQHTQAMYMRETAGFSAKEVAEWQKVFDKFDRDDSDTISEEEMQRVLSIEFKSVSEEECHLICQDAQKAGLCTAGIDFLEFLVVMRAHADRMDVVRLKEEEEKNAKDKDRLERKRKEEERQARELFEVADQDGDKSLSFEEVQEMIGVLVDLSSTLMQSRLEQIFNDVDKDDSGTINFREFQKLITRLHQEDFGGISTTAEQMAADDK